MSFLSPLAVVNFMEIYGQRKRRIQKKYHFLDKVSKMRKRLSSKETNKFIAIMDIAYICKTR